MSSPSTTSPFTVIYAFGDSTADAGNVSLGTAPTSPNPISPPYYSQTYGSSVAAEYSNGPVWVQDLAQDLGLGVLAPSRAGGTDFAYGGAATGVDPQTAGQPSLVQLSVPAQLARFSTSILQPSSTALYTLSVGGADILDIVNKGVTTAQQQTTDVAAAVNNELSDISTMYNDGMRNIAVMNVGNLGDYPIVTQALGGSGTIQAQLDTLTTNLCASFNSQLASGLAALAATDQFNYVIVDADSYINSAVSNPSAYGYTNVTTPVWTGNFLSPNSGVLSSSNPAVQNQSLFFDDYHLTETGQANLANIAYTELSSTFVAQANLTTGTTSLQLANVYSGTQPGLTSEFATVTPENVGLFATTPGNLLQAGSGNDILVANSGTNVLTTSGGSSYLASGTGTDTFDTTASATTASWNELANFHAGDVLNIVGYLPGVSQVEWTTVPGVDGAVLNINVAGSGTVWTSDTFLGVSLSQAQNFTTSVSTANGVSTYTVAA